MEQLEAMRQLQENWDGYGGAPPEPHVIELAKELLQFLDRQLGNACQIHATPGRNGGVSLEWEDAVHEHELGIDPDGSLSFLHFNKSTQQIATKRFTAETKAAISPGLLSELCQMVAA